MSSRDHRSVTPLFGVREHASATAAVHEHGRDPIRTFLNVLYEKDWIHDPKGKAKSAVLAKEGTRLADEILSATFSGRQRHSADKKWLEMKPGPEGGFDIIVDDIVTTFLRHSHR